MNAHDEGRRPMRERRVRPACAAAADVGTAGSSSDGSYKFVRRPNIPGLSWKAGGRCHIEFPDGPAKPGTMPPTGGGTTTAGAASRETSGGGHFTLTPTEACTP
jgi:hypothetical protein